MNEFLELLLSDTKGQSTEHRILIEEETFSFLFLFL